MKRKNYKVYLNGSQVAVKHAFNSSIREIERLVKLAANADKSNYDLIASGGEKEDHQFVYGFRYWLGSNGKPLHFKVYLQ